MKAKPTHGGARHCSGPKPKLGKPMTRYNVMLDFATVVTARAIGNGNMSEGIRIAVARMRRRKDD